MTGIQVPLLIAGRIAVGAGVAPPLNVTVEVDVQMVVAPETIPCGRYGCYVLHALIHRGFGRDILLGLCVEGFRRGLRIGEGVSCCEGEPVWQDYFHGCIDALDGCLVDVGTLTDGGPSCGRKGRELRIACDDFRAQRAVVDHIADLIDEGIDADVQPRTAVVDVGIPEMALLGLQCRVGSRVA